MELRRAAARLRKLQGAALGVTGLLVLVAGTTGCATLREVPMDPAVRQELGSGPPLLVVRRAPVPLGYYAPGFSQALRADFHEVPGVAAPAPELERAFLEAVGARIRLPQLAPSDGPAEARSPDALWLDLTTTSWNIDGRGLKRLVGRCTLQYGVTATLVLPDGAVLWRAFHHGTRLRGCGALFADDLKLVQELRPELAREGAEALARSFLAGTASAAAPRREAAGPEPARPEPPRPPPRRERPRYTGFMPLPLFALRSTGVRNGYVSGGLGLGRYGPVHDPQWLGVIAGAESGEGGKASFGGLGWFAGEGIVAAQLRVSLLHTRRHANGVGPEVDYRGAEAIALLMGLNLSVSVYRRAGGPAEEPPWLLALGTGIGF